MEFSAAPSRLIITVGVAQPPEIFRMIPGIYGSPCKTIDNHASPNGTLKSADSFRIGSNKNINITMTITDCFGLAIIPTQAPDIPGIVTGNNETGDRTLANTPKSCATKAPNIPTSDTTLDENILDTQILRQGPIAEGADQTQLRATPEDCAVDRQIPNRIPLPIYPAAE